MERIFLDERVLLESLILNLDRQLG